MRRGLWQSALLALFASGCARAVRLELPPAPPPRPASELARWQSPPPLAPHEPLELDWDTARARLPNGLGVSAVSRPDSASTALWLWLPDAADASQGPVAVMIEALRAGTLTRSGDLVVNPRLARQAIRIETDATGTTFGWEVLPRSTELGLTLLADFVMRPAFDANETRVVLQHELARIQRDSGSLWHLANLARAQIRGLDLPTPWSDALGLLQVTPERLESVHRCVVHLGGAELVLVGPAPAGELLAAARAAFAELDSPGPAAGECAGLPEAPSLEGATPNTRAELQIVHGGTFDPILVLVTPGPATSSPEHLPFTLAAAVLDSRDAASRGLRHTGATYGINANVNERFHGGTLLEIAGQVAPEEAQNALRTLVRDLQDLHRTLGEEELEKVKRRLESDFLDSLTSNRGLGRATLDRVRRGRSPASLRSWPRELRSVSLDRCREVAARWLGRAEPSIAVAGVSVPLVRGLGFRTNVRRLYWTERLPEGKKAL